jgi:pyridoxal phosphate enzyme (YggS family)
VNGLVDAIVARTGAARTRIERAGGDPDGVRIVAVTKAFGPAEVAAGFQAGLTEFGENYADELVTKWAAVAGQARWHFLGAIQRNKVSRLAPYVDCWQAVARVVEGEAIERHRTELSTKADGQFDGRASLLVEVETTGVAGRGGCSPDQVPALVAQLRTAGCQVDGLMTVAPPGGAAPARAAFDLVARLAAELGLKELSMGMSEDLEQAVAAGATMVRLGTALFGPRPPRRRL